MTVFTAHLRPGRNPVLVREGWSWGALVFGPLWLLARGALIAAVLDAAALVLTAALMPPPLRGLTLAGLVLLNGLCGRDLVRWSLGLRGYTMAHVIAARDSDSALARLYAARADLLEQVR